MRQQNGTRDVEGMRAGPPVRAGSRWDYSREGGLPRQRQGPTQTGGSGMDRDDFDGVTRSCPRKKRRVLRWFSVSMSLLILATAGAGYLYYEHLNGNLSKDLLNLGDNKLDKSKPNAAGQTPLNILLLGSDSRGSDKNSKLGGAKATATGPRWPMCRCCCTSPRTAATCR